jgi:magnesium chelatase subunit I
MQEGDVQIKGYPVRLALDVLLCFTANPEDYTARGKIITPLKDRIGSEIITHYPEHVELGMSITKQEAWSEREGRPLDLVELVPEVIERVAFEARNDRRIDHRSGVSQRLPITVLENVISNAERRAVSTGESRITPRIADLYAALPAITGKLELEYEGELMGGAAIARELIRRAADATLRDRVGPAAMDDVVMWFDAGAALQVTDEVPTSKLRAAFDAVPGLSAFVEEMGLSPAGDDAAFAVACELVLESLVARRKLSRSESGRYGAAEREPRRRRGHDEDER